MSNPRDGRKLRGGLTKLAHALMVAGVLGCLLPLVGLQLRRLQDLDLGVWTGVPFIALAIVIYAIAPLAEKRSGAFRKAFKLGAIGFVVLIAGGFVLGMVLKNSGFGTPDPEQRSAQAMAELDTLRETRFPDHQAPSPPPALRERAERPPQTATSATLPDEHWSIPVAQDMDVRTMNRFGRMLKERAAGMDDVRHVSVLKGMNGITIRVHPHVEEATVLDLLDGFGSHTLDANEHTGRFTLDAESPGSAWRAPGSWIVRVSADEVSLRTKSRIKRAVRDELPDRGDECEFLEIDGVSMLIAGPIDNHSFLRRVLSPFGDMDIDAPNRTVSLTLRNAP